MTGKVKGRLPSQLKKTRRIVRDSEVMRETRVARKVDLSRVDRRKVIARSARVAVSIKR